MLERGSHSVWLIIPLIYFLGWWQTGSFRQAFNGTVAWIIAYAIVAGTLLLLDVGGLSGMTATPDSPAAGIAILGGFIGMWISNYLWRRRGGDPPRKYGKWERSARAMLGMDKKKKKKKPARQQPPPPPQQPMPPPQQQPVAAAPVDAQYRPVQGPPPGQQPAPQQQQRQGTHPQPAPQFQQAQVGPQPQQQPAPSISGKKPTKQRNSPTADKYAKATGRALGAMFRGSDKKKSKSSNNR